MTIEPFGYFAIFFRVLEILCLSGFLLLFFLERRSYGRSSLGRESWPKVLLYDLLTAGTYGIYWRLRTTYALFSRDRLSSFVWILMLGALFVVSLTLSWLGLIFVPWDFVIRHRFRVLAGLEASGIWTFFFGPLHLAQVIEGRASLLPLDFRERRPQRSRRIVILSSLLAGSTMLVIGLGYLGLWQARQQEFASLPNDHVDRSGTWHEVSERYETIYQIDDKGLKTVHTSGQHPYYSNRRIQLNYSLQTKLHGDQLYSFTWFTCIRKDRVIERRDDMLVFKTAMERTQIENRLKPEDFEQKKRDFHQLRRASWGWELGEFLKSPWNCELRFIQDAWVRYLSA